MAQFVVPLMFPQEYFVCTMFGVEVIIFICMIWNSNLNDTFWNTIVIFLLHCRTFKGHIILFLKKF